MKTTKIKCTKKYECGTKYDACLDNDYTAIECPQCQNKAYSIIDPNYQGPWKIDSKSRRIWKEKMQLIEI